MSWESPEILTRREDAMLSSAVLQVCACCLTALSKPPMKAAAGLRRHLCLYAPPPACCPDIRVICQDWWKRGEAFCDTPTSLQGNQPDIPSTVLGNGHPDDNSFQSLPTWI